MKRCSIKNIITHNRLEMRAKSRKTIHTYERELRYECALINNI